MISLPNNVDPEDLLNTLRELSWEASDLFRSYQDNIYTSDEFQTKLNIIELESGPVTNADIAINDLIKKKFRDKYPCVDWDFLTEEDNKDNFNKEFNNDWVWVIDPLDGTKDFIEGTGQYAMHIALLFKEKLIIGIVLIPNKEQLWINIEGKKTWFENKEKKKFSSSATKLKFLSQARVLTSKSHMHKDFKFLLDKIDPQKTIGMGSIGYKITSILRGEADIYISYSLKQGSCPKDWDMAAPASLIKGAGGYFTKLNGEELDFLNKDFNQPGILIASLSHKHKEICSQISSIVKGKYL